MKGFCCWIAFLCSSFNGLAQRDLLLVRGPAGAEVFEAKFEAQADHWRRATDYPDFRLTEAFKREEIRAYLKAPPQEGPLWIVFIGHGTFDGKTAKFNLKGPDLSDSDWVELLKPLEREIILVNTSAGSAPFLKALAAENRVVLTATRSGYETSYAHLGEFLAPAFNAMDADFDKDGRVALLEAFIHASRRVEEFYTEEGRIQTEHALLDDNGDGKGTQGDWFVGVRPDLAKLKKAKPDGYRALQIYLAPEPDTGLTDAQRKERDRLERRLFTLRDQKAELNEQVFYERLEALLTRLNTFYPPSSE